MAMEPDVQRTRVWGIPAIVLGETASLLVLGCASTPAQAQENYAEDFAQGVGNNFAGPALLALPIVVGAIVATVAAGIIYFSSQPREEDN